MRSDRNGTFRNKSKRFKTKKKTVTFYGGPKASGWHSVRARYNAGIRRTTLVMNNFGSDVRHMYQFLHAPRRQNILP
jgi:hypothetical protein